MIIRRLGDMDMGNGQNYHNVQCGETALRVRGMLNIKKPQQVRLFESLALHLSGKNHRQKAEPFFSESMTSMVQSLIKIG